MGEENNTSCNSPNINKKNNDSSRMDVMKFPLKWLSRNPNQGNNETIMGWIKDATNHSLHSTSLRGELGSRQRLEWPSGVSKMAWKTVRKSLLETGEKDTCVL